MLAIQGDKKRKALHTIQVPTSCTSKKETQTLPFKTLPSQESNVETKRSKRKLHELDLEDDINDTIETKSVGVKVYEDNNATEEEENPKHSKKQRFEPIEERNTTPECQECLKRIQDEQMKLMTSDEAPLEYWKELSEQRRQALEVALKENESLHDQIEVLEAENNELKEMAEQAKQLAEILESLNDNEEDDGTN